MSNEPVPADDLPGAGSPVPANDMQGQPADMQLSQQEKPPMGVMDALKMAGQQVVVHGGLIAGGIGLAKPVMDTVNKAIEHGAYKAGGVVTDLSAGHVSPETAALLGVGTNVGVQALPMLLGRAIGEKAAPAMNRVSQELMQSALKPSTKELATGKGARAVKTLLQKGVNVTPRGIEKLRSEIDTLDEAISAAIARSPASVDKVQVANRLRDAVNRFKMQVTPQSDMKVINRAWDEFINHPLLTGKERIPVQLAQKLKQGTYKVLESKAYGETGTASVEAQKALARGLKEEIANAVPNIGKLNKEESELLNALEIASRRVLVDANKNPMGLGWLAMHPGTWLGFAADRSPLVKSLLSRLISAGAKVIPQAAGDVVGGAAGYSLGTAPTFAPKVAQPPRPLSVNPTRPINGAYVENPRPSPSVGNDGVRG